MVTALAPVGEYPDIFGDDCGLPLIPSRYALHLSKIML